MSASVRNIKLWLIECLYRDLHEYHAGDEGRFTRMVGAGGKQFDNATPAGWVRSIRNLSHQVGDCERLAAIEAQLVTWGYKPEVAQ